MATREVQFPPFFTVLKKQGKKNRSLYSQQVAADSCEDETGDDHPVREKGFYTLYNKLLHNTTQQIYTMDVWAFDLWQLCFNSRLNVWIQSFSHQMTPQNKMQKKTLQTEERFHKYECW